MTKTDKPAKKKRTYTETYKKGLYYRDRDRVAGWADNDDVWITLVNAGNNDDGTEFVTITFDNINPDVLYENLFRAKLKTSKNKPHDKD